MKKFARGGMIPWLLLGLIGFLLIFFSKPASRVLEIVIAIGLIIAGIGCAIGWWKQGAGRDRSNLLALVLSAAAIILGIWILTHLEKFDNALNVIIGVGLLLVGLQWFILNWKSVGLNTETVLSAIAIILGVVIIATYKTTSIPFVLAGIGMLYAAGCGVVNELKK